MKDLVLEKDNANLGKSKTEFRQIFSDATLILQYGIGVIIESIILRQSLTNLTTSVHTFKYLVCQAEQEQRMLILLVAALDNTERAKRQFGQVMFIGIQENQIYGFVRNRFSEKLIV
jgi:UDP-N-acetyl-D-mannosaminuronic acid transferase (WecB/TagA/CpsF family)